MINKIIGIVFAMDKEINEYLSIVKEYKTEKIGIYTFYILNLDSNKIVMTKSGIGKVQAGSLTSLLINFYHPDIVFNSGIAGGVDRNLKLLDTVIGTKLIYSDVDMTSDTSIDVKYGQLQGFDRYFKIDNRLKEQIEQIDDTLIFGSIMSGDQFITSREKVDFLVNTYFSDLDIQACDMESTAIAQVCEENKVLFVAIRTISDVVGNNNVIDYATFAVQACKKSANLINKIIKKTNPFD